MKLRGFFLAFLLALVVVGVAWLIHSKSPLPENSAKAPILAKANAPAVSRDIPTTLSKGKESKPFASSALTPTNAIAAKQANTESADGAQATVANQDPQADLKTAIPDIARLQRDGNYAEIYRIYTPPDKLDPAVMQQLLAIQKRTESDAAQDPKLQQQLQQIHDAGARAYEALALQTPAYNPTGDEATYEYSASELTLQPGSTLKTFVRINGKWYEKPPDTKGTALSN